MTNFLDAANLYASYGFSVVPIEPGLKRPPFPWKKYQETLPTKDELKKWFSKDRFQIGIVTGRLSNLTVIDADTQEGIDFMKGHGVEPTVKTKKGFHYWFKYNPLIPTAVRNLPGCDTRNDGGLIVAPPSPGKELLVDMQSLNLGTIKDSILNLIKPKGRNEDGWMAEVLSNLRPGNRRDSLLKIIGRLIHDGWDKPSIVAFLQPYIKQFNEEGVTEEASVAVEKIIDDLKNKESLSNNIRFPSLDQILALPSPNWVIKDILPEASIAILAGLPEAGKTFVTIDLAFELSTENPKWLGKFEAHKSSVLYVDEESPLAFLQDRIKACYKSRPVVDKKNITWAIRENIQLFGEGLERFRGLMRSVRPRVVIVDSLSCVCGREENSASEMMIFFQNIKELAKEFDASFVFIDHENKGVFQAQQAGIAPSLTQIRGSIVKAQVADTIFTLRRNGSVMTLYHTKSRWAERQNPMFINLIKTENKGIILRTES